MYVQIIQFLTTKKVNTMTEVNETKPEIQAPAGFVFNATGDLIKESNLTPQQKEDNALVNTLFPMARELNKKIAHFKYVSMHLVEEVIERCLKEHKIVKFKKIKGNVQFVTFDGLLKVQRSISDQIEANSISEVARQLLGQYRDALKRDSGNDANEWIDITFEDKSGKLSVHKIFDFMNKDIEHPLYRQAVEALRKSLFTSGTKAALRFYYRENTDQEWLALPLQFSSIQGINPDENIEEDQTNEEQKEDAA